MKALTVIAFISLLFSNTLLANEKATARAKAHLEGLLTADTKKLEGTYGSTVSLMPGHEFLKSKYGLGGAEGRAGAADVDRAKLLEAMKKATEGRPKRSAEKIAAMMKSIGFKSLRAPEGDFSTNPADPVQTPDGKLHFTIVKGDVLLKGSRPSGDFVLFQMREVKGAWQVVAEYLTSEAGPQRSAGAELRTETEQVRRHGRQVKRQWSESPSISQPANYAEDTDCLTQWPGLSVVPELS